MLRATVAFSLQPTRERARRQCVIQQSDTIIACLVVGHLCPDFVCHCRSRFTRFQWRWQRRHIFDSFRRLCLCCFARPIRRASSWLFRGWSWRRGRFATLCGVYRVETDEPLTPPALRASAAYFEMRRPQLWLSAVDWILRPLSTVLGVSASYALSLVLRAEAHLLDELMC